MMEKAKILLVEDDINLGYVIKDNLLVNGYDVQLCDDGQKGWHAFLKGGYDLCILDVMLPKIDGFSLAGSIRSRNAQIPILFLSAKSMKEDKIAGFKTGGDDYITKPFSIEELVLRIEVFLKRSQGNQINTDPKETTQKYPIGTFEFDFKNLSLHHGKSEKHLTQKEADILKLFCDNPGEVLKREHILKTIWGDDDYFMGRSLDVFISKLRKYLKADPKIEIVNYHGVGFKLEKVSNQ